jgi:hypothetical protein
MGSFGFLVERGSPYGCPPVADAIVEFRLFAERFGLFRSLNISLIPLHRHLW